jgi:hypothetical protein
MWYSEKEDHMTTKVLSLAAGLALSVSPAFGQLWVNGPLATGNTAGSGTAAPAGTQWSECAEDCASPTTSNTTAGFRALQGTDRCADDFTIPTGQTWNITNIVFAGYQTGGTTTPTITGVTVRIFDGPPNAGGNVIFGDTTTNRLASAAFSNIYRTFNTTSPPACGGAPTAAATNRPIYSLTTTINTTLSAGTYWVDFAYTGTLASGPWVPLTTLTNCGRQANPNANALQSIDGGTTWVMANDAGQGCLPTPVAQDYAFTIEGTSGGGGGCYANCDGSTTLPFLNVDDFVCFQQSFAAGASYANCDNSTNIPVLNVNDFVCFQQAFAAGCSAP